MHMSPLRFLLLSLCLLRGSSKQWSRLYPDSPLPENGVSSKDIINNDAVEYLQWGCVFNAHLPKHSVNKWHDLEAEPPTETLNQTRQRNLEDPCFVRGNTIWVNEHQAVGHAMYDIFDMQLMDLTDVKIDRLVLQRAPCMTHDLCQGIGTFESFFKGMYTAMVEAFAPGIPVYMRFMYQERTLTPFYFNSSAPNGIMTPPTIDKLTGKRMNNCYQAKWVLSPVKCVQAVWRRKCNHCFQGGISAPTVRKFQKAAYNLLSKKPKDDPNRAAEIPPHHFSLDKPIVVLLAFRGLKASTRRLNNIKKVQEMLQTTLVEPIFDLRVLDTANNTRGYVEQMRYAAESQVVVAEHGAFASHLMYMRNGSLWIEIRGNYKNGEATNYERLAKLFGVFFEPIVARDLEYHKATKFELKDKEILQLVETILQYAKDKPFSHNTRI